MVPVKQKPVERQVVVVIGASSGIGRETALLLASRGAKVVASARGEPGLRSLIDEITAAGGESTYVVADVANFAAVERIAAHAVERFGRLDSWVHAAGVGLYATVEQTTPEEFSQVIAVNLLGQIHGAKAALLHFRRQGSGTLIHVSSVEARRGLPLHAAYAASKHGVAGFVQALRVELLHEDLSVTVTEILPAAINTPFFTRPRNKAGRKLRGVPPMYQPRVVAAAILYALEHPVRDLVVGGAGWGLLAADALAPRLLDAVLARVGFRMQLTSKPVRVPASGNLYEPNEAEERTEGDFGSLARTRSYSTWLATHPGPRHLLLAALTAGAAVAFSTRAERRRPHT